MRNDKRLTPGRLVGIDALVAGGYLVVGVVPLLVSGRLGVGPVLSDLAPVTVAAVAMGVRRLRPLPAFVVALAALAVSGVLAGLSPYLTVAAPYTLYTVALSQPRRRWIPTVAIAVLSTVGLLGMTMMGPTGRSPGGAGQRLAAIVFGLVLLGCAWTLGRAVRDRREYAERWAEEMAERAVSDERLRLARELHDVVAHALGVIAVKAGVANHVISERPAEAHDALRIIETTSRDALTEMRHLLGVLRSDGPVERSPTLGLGGLPGLAERAALVGVPVELCVQGGELVPEGVGVSVYRIVQESVTNVVKHAAPARCRVLVAGTHDAVRVEVTDDGPGSRSLPGTAHRLPDTGHGLLGMRERVHAYGGHFSAGPRPAGGFVVHAELPYRSVP